MKVGYIQAGATQPSGFREIVLLISLAMLWGAPYALTRISLQTIAPMTIVGVRTAIAAVILWIVVFSFRRKIPIRPGLARDLFVQGCLSATIPYTLTTWGQQSVDSTLAVILNSTSPIFVCLVTMGWTRQEPITPTRLIGVIAGLCGVAFVVGLSSLESLGRELLSQAAIVAATFSLALAVVYGRRFAGVPPEVTAAGMLSWSAVTLMPIALFMEWPPKSMPSVSSGAALLTNAAFCTALGFVLYFRLVGVLGPMTIASCGYLKIGMGVFLGYAILGESFTWQIQVGLLGILIGVTAMSGVHRCAWWPHWPRFEKESVLRKQYRDVPAVKIGGT